MTKPSPPQNNAGTGLAGVLMAGEEAALQTAMRYTRPAHYMAHVLRRALGFEDVFQRVLAQLETEKAIYDAYRQSPGAEAEYREVFRSGQEALQLLYRKINGWMQNELRRGTWLAFAIEVPMADVPRHQVLLPQQWQLLSLNGWDDIATGGGRRYELVRIVDLSVLSADEATGVRDALIRKTSWPSDGVTPANANGRVPPSRQPKRRPPDYGPVLQPPKRRRPGPACTWMQHLELMEERAASGLLEPTLELEIRALIRIGLVRKFTHRPHPKTLKNALGKRYRELRLEKRS